MWEKYELLADFGQRFLTCRPVSILPLPVIGAITLNFTSVLLQPWEVFLIFLHVNPGENEDKGGRRVVEYLQIPELIALTRTCIYPQHGHRVTPKNQLLYPPCARVGFPLCSPAGSAG